MTENPDPTMLSISLPETQTVLLLHGTNQPYRVTDDYPLPQLKEKDEVLVRTEYIGLNPVDWKSPDYGFSIPELPYVAGRELVGTIVKTAGESTRLKPGQKVIVISTDYRDLRKGAFQQFAVARDINVVKMPWHLPLQQGATVGVVFVAAALALGVCMGVDFSSICDGPNLLEIIRSLDPETLPKDIRHECLQGISREDVAKSGDWLAIWGGSSNSASIALQLARLVGLRTVTVVDAAKHGARLLNGEIMRPDILVDSHDSMRAADVVRGVTEGRLRFGLDTGSRASGSALLRALDGSIGTIHDKSPLSPPATPRGYSAHLIGMSGLPQAVQGSQTMLHSVPIKLFHEVPEVGLQLSIWLEKLLYNKMLEMPRIVDIEDGLHAVNKGLDRMRRHEISGGKLVVKVS